MARVYVPYSTQLAALPITESIADYANARLSQSLSSGDEDLQVVDVDANVSPWWMLFAASATPTSWSEAVGVIDLLDYNTTNRLQYAFTTTSGLTLSVFPRGIAKSNWSEYAVECEEVEAGLYVVEVNRDFRWWDIFEGSSVFTNWTDRIGQIYTASSGNANSYGPIGNFLSVDYENDWLYLDGIEDLGLIFSADRVTTQVAPNDGIKAKRSSPNTAEVAIAASSFGFEDTDMVFVVWSQTLMHGTTVRAPIRPKGGDVLTASDANWVIKSVKQNTDQSQWRCYCRRSTKEEL